jgi:hypothetical protein
VRIAQLIVLPGWVGAYELWLRELWLRELRLRLAELRLSVLPGIVQNIVKGLSEKVSALGCHTLHDALTRARQH